MRGQLLTTVWLLTLSLVMAELPHWMDTNGHGEDELARMMGEHHTTDHPSNMDLYQRSLVLDTCQVQTQVLERLRELVVDSIAQVKKCMAIDKEYQYRLASGIAHLITLQGFF